MHFRKANQDELPIALALLKQAAQALKDKQINQWSFWLAPPIERINWVKEGFDNSEFHFVENDLRQVIAMFRLMAQDKLYWGEQSEAAHYTHSLVVAPKYKGQRIGERIIAEIETLSISQKIKRLRLDCNASSLALCAYYERLGFVKVGQKQMPHSLNNLYEKKLD